MPWDEEQGGAFEMLVLLVVIRSDNHNLLLDLFLIAISCLVNWSLFLTGFMQWMGTIP